MFLYGKPDASLCAGDPFFCCKLYGALVLQIAFHLDPHTLQSSFADTAGCHRDVCDNGLDSAFLDGLIQGSYGTFVRMQQILHFKIGGGMYGME